MKYVLVCARLNDIIIMVLDGSMTNNFFYNWFSHFELSFLSRLFDKSRCFSDLILPKIPIWFCVSIGGPFCLIPNSFSVSLEKKSSSLTLQVAWKSVTWLLPRLSTSKFAGRTSEWVLRYYTNENIFSSFVSHKLDSASF